MDPCTALCQAAAQGSLSSLRQVDLSSSKEHLICAVAPLSDQKKNNISRKFYGLHFVIDLVDLVTE